MITVMPMAGRGSRFSGTAYDRPKPLISVNGVPMFALALESLRGIEVSTLVIVSLREHEEKYDLTGLIKKHVPYPTKLVLLDNVTEGQLCTVMAAEEFMDTDEDVLIVSSDTIIASDLGNDIRKKSGDCKGIISVADMPGDQWSFAETDASGTVTRVAEKVRISDHASTGMYYFTNGRELCALASDMIAKQEKTRGEYYVIPVYQKFIERGDRITVSEASRMWDLGTPENLGRYEAYLRTQNT